MEKKKVILLCSAVAVTAAFVAGLFMYFYMASQERGNEIRMGEGSNYDDLAQYMKIGDLEQMINDHYYQDANEDELVTGALKGMVDSLGDPYSAYYTEEEYAACVASQEGTSVGIGATVTSITPDSGYLEVTNVYGGSPAEAAGIAVGDLITGVDGKGIGDLDFDGAISMISGPSGSAVVLTVQTGNEARNVELTRTEMQTPFVAYSMLDDEIGYIVISEFHGNCVEQFKESLRKLKEEEGATGVVIDLRGNMGGAVTSAADMLDEILPEGLIGYSVDKNGEKNELRTDGTYDGIPLALIVNDSTASAGEIFAGAIQDNGRGKLVGTQTYGKGVLQITQEMPYGSGGGVKLTTATYFTPNGNAINGVGIMPDEIVNMPEEGIVISQDTDPQIQAARAAVRELIGG